MDPDNSFLRWNSWTSIYKRLESFSSYNSYSLYWRILKKKRILLWFKKPYEKIGETRKHES